MDATGLKPSSARRCYPTHEYDSRPPVADHDHCWFDPDARVHILSTEPYPGRSERGEPRQIEWERRHGWSTMYVDWGSIYGNRSEEHTSELQSLMRISYAVFCLKKKTQNNTRTRLTSIYHVK